MTDMISLRDVSKSFQKVGDPLTILKDVNLTVAEGETVAITGPSGSGKTSLLMILAGIELASSGSVEVLGHDLTSMTENERILFRGSSLGMIFQNYLLVDHLTALENVAIPMLFHHREEAYDLAHELLQKVGLGDRESHYPHQLSGGECQRVGIARALIKRPRVILADEPTGNLDRETAQAVADLFFEIVSQYGCSAILVTHNQHLASSCQRVLSIQKGNLIHDSHEG